MDFATEELRLALHVECDYGIQVSMFDRINSSNNEFKRFKPLKTFSTFQWF
jgi:hypothetical protein